jgi:hypothetical protein
VRQGMGGAAVDAWAAQGDEALVYGLVMQQQEEASRRQGGRFRGRQRERRAGGMAIAQVKPYCLECSYSPGCPGCPGCAASTQGASSATVHDTQPGYITHACNNDQQPSLT